MDVEEIWYHGHHGNVSDLTRGLRLQVQADGEMVTKGTIDCLEDVESQARSILVVEAEPESADMLLDDLVDGFESEISAPEESLSSDDL